jgi:hypothetical protein
MPQKSKLYMLLLGCRPEGRFTEQHDIFFGIGNSLKELIPKIKAFWPEAKGKIHIDAWREVNTVDGFEIAIIPKIEYKTSENELFFVNLGGYKQNEFEEYHYKMLTVAKNSEIASLNAKATPFFKLCSFSGAPSHIDDKFGVDVDELYNVKEILTFDFVEKWDLEITKSTQPLPEDELHLGYLKLEKII